MFVLLGIHHQSGLACPRMPFRKEDAIDRLQGLLRILLEVSSVQSSLALAMGYYLADLQNMSCSVNYTPLGLGVVYYPPSFHSLWFPSPIVLVRKELQISTCAPCKFTPPCKTCAVCSWHQIGEVNSSKNQISESNAECSPNSSAFPSPPPTE